MDVTPNLNLPFPEGTDYIGEGDLAIRGLAEGIETALFTATHIRLGEFGSGFSATTVSGDWFPEALDAWRIGPLVQISMTFQYLGTGLSVGSLGDLTDLAVLTITPSDPASLNIRPVGPSGLASHAAGRVATGRITASGNNSIVALSAVAGSTDIATGNKISLAGLYLTTDPA